MSKFGQSKVQAYRELTCRRVFDPGGLWLRIDCCQGCRVARRHLLSDTKYLGTLFIHSLTTMERGRREEGIVMAWEAI